MSARPRFALLVTIVALLAAVPASYAIASHGSGYAGAAKPSKLEIGKQLYRKYCGQCHALRAALAAGFGSDKGLGRDGGPSFNNLRVPFNLSFIAVTGQFSGHELIMNRLNWTQLHEVSAFVAVATKNNPYLARQTDG